MQDGVTRVRAAEAPLGEVAARLVAQSLPAFVILPPGLRTEKPCVISELFETMVAGSFMTSAEMVALLVTVSEVVTAPSGYFTVMVDSSGFCQNHLS